MPAAGVRPAWECDAIRPFDDKLSTTFLVSLVYPLGPAAIILMPMLVGGMIDDLGFTEQQAGTVAALEGLGLVISSIVAALWIRRVSWTTMLALSCIVTALLNGLTSQLSDFVPFVAVRFLAGLSAGAVFALAVAALGDNRHPDRAFGIAQVVQGAMMFVAFSVAATILERWTVAGLYWLLAAAALAMLLTLVRYPSEGAPRAVPAPGSGAASSFTGLIWIGLIASLLFFSNIFGFWTYIERIGAAAGLDTATIGSALAFSQFAAIVGAGAAALASDRFGRVAPLALALVGQLVVLWLLVGQFTPFTYYLGSGLFQALFVLATAYQLGAIAKIDLTGRFLVVVTGFQGLGSAVGPGIAAALITEGDYSRINLMAGAFLTVSIGMFFFIIYRTRHFRSPMASGLA